MPSIGLVEIIVIVAVIVIFVRPEDVPKFVRTVGKIYTDFQRSLYKVRQVGRETLDDITKMDKIATPEQDKLRVDPEQSVEDSN